MEFDFDEFLKQMQTNAEYSHLHKTHPNFDNYPDYLKHALVENEILQGRVKRTKTTK